VEPRRSLPELLAPAGSPAALLSALEAGADAVYAGTPLFSARGRAANFTLAELEGAAALCRREGRRLYAAVNTLVLDRELPALAGTLAALADMRVDAVILQDPGAALLARERFPSLRLHASTQMTLHDLPGLREAAARGFSRAVLARELPLSRVGELVRHSPVEAEVFVHGALCHSVSGQCLLSSWMGGRSGNRGWCAQPCRRRFDAAGVAPYPFSTRDLCALPAVPALVSAGVAALKIEGRMKPPGWVASVVAAYRAVLDAPPDGMAEALARSADSLSRLAGRESTGGPLLGAAPASVAGLAARASFGERIGTVESCAEGEATFVASARIHAGDRIRIVASGDREGRSFTLRPFLAGGRRSTVAAAGTRVAVAVPHPVRPGDALERSADEGGSAISAESARKTLLGALPEPAEVTVRGRRDGDRAVLAAESEGVAAEQWAGGVTEGASGGRDLASVLEERLAETGGTPFRLGRCDLAPLSGLFLPPSLAKDLRRRLYRELSEKLSASREERSGALLRSALEFLTSAAEPPPPAPPAPTPTPPPVAARLGGFDEAADLEEHGGADRYLLPLPRTRGEALSAASALSGLEGRVLFSLPFWCPTEEARSAEDRVVHLLLNRGFGAFEANNPSHLHRLVPSGAWILAGWRLHAMNRLALSALARRGARAVLLSPEDEGENVASLLAGGASPERWICVHGRIPLLVSLLGPFPPEPLPVRAPGGGDRFLLSTEEGTAVLRPETPFSLAGHLDRLSGAAAFVADLVGTDRADRPLLLASLRVGLPPEGSTTFNFERRLH
jgi:putative protease